jgi:hypothetical protein
VSEIAALSQVALAAAIVAAPVVLFVRWLSAGEPLSLANLFSAPDYGAWPRGVQEGEPIRWRTSIVDTPRTLATEPDQARQREGTRSSCRAMVADCH